MCVLALSSGPACMHPGIKAVGPQGIENGCMHACAASACSQQQAAAAACMHVRVCTHSRQCPLLGCDACQAAMPRLGAGRMTPPHPATQSHAPAPQPNPRRLQERVCQHDAWRGPHDARVPALRAARGAAAADAQGRNGVHRGGPRVALRAQRPAGKQASKHQRAGPGRALRGHGGDAAAAARMRQGMQAGRHACMHIWRRGCRPDLCVGIAIQSGSKEWSGGAMHASMPLRVSCPPCVLIEGAHWAEAARSPMRAWGPICLAMTHVAACVWRGRRAARSSSAPVPTCTGAWWWASTAATTTSRYNNFFFKVYATSCDEVRRV